MITVENALAIIQKHLPSLKTTEVSIHDLGPGLTQEDLKADRDYPSINRVMMDGIALSWEVFKTGQKDFQIEGVCAAGDFEQKLENQTNCLEVMTGAPLPLGTDLVIPYEHIRLQNGLATITLELDRPRFDNVHLKASDARVGDVILKAGETLSGPNWGIAASLGFQKIKIKKNPRINIISTGDELVPVDETPLPHQLRRSNAYALKASLVLFGHKDITLSHLPDEVGAIKEHYKLMSKKADILIYSGGVSKGKFDYLPATWKELGVEELFHGVSQRPGKPLWFGVDHSSDTTILGLPGNPVSGLVCLHRYFLGEKKIYAKLGKEIFFKKDLTYFVPVKLEYSKDASLKAWPLELKNSGDFSGLAGSDGFIELPKEKSHLKEDEVFRFYPWRPM